jgi:hypothetical protein
MENKPVMSFPVQALGVLALFEPTVFRFINISLPSCAIFMKMIAYLTSLNVAGVGMISKSKFFRAFE